MTEYNTSSLLVPRELVHEIASGAAEIIVEKNNCELETVVGLEKKVNKIDSVGQDVNKDNRINWGFIHIFDEDERREQLRLPNLSEKLRTVHETKLRQLQWARSTLLADERVSAFLSSRSASLWPDVESLTEVVNVVRTLKEFTDVPPDPRGAARMQEAMQIIVNEARYSGVHTLISAPVAGKLTVYKNKKLKMESSSHSPQRQEQAEEKANLTRDHTISMHPVQWLLQISRNCYIPPDVLRLPMTVKTHESLLNLLHNFKRKKEEINTNNANSLNNTNVRKDDNKADCNYINNINKSSDSERKKELLREWLQIVAMHRESLMRNNMPLFYSVQDAVRTFQITETYLIELMQRAAEASAKVRIRGGVYATVIHRLEIFIILVEGGTSTTTATVAKMPSDKDRERASDMMLKNMLTSEERNVFYKVAHMEYDTAVYKGLVLHALHDCRGNAELEQVLRENFLSPLTCTSYVLEHDENHYTKNCSSSNHITENSNNSNNNKESSHNTEILTNHVLDNANTLSKREYQRISVTSHTLSSQTTVKHVQCEFNPFIIIHGNRVEDGFRGRTEVFESLKRQRDAIAEEQTERVLRGEYNELREHARTSATERPSSSITIEEEYSPYALSAHGESPSDQYKKFNSDVINNSNQGANAMSTTMGKKSVTALSSSPIEYFTSSVTSDDDALKELSRVVISVLSDGPATRAELTRQPRLARWVHHVRFDALLKNVLKMHTEYRGRKYHLREE